MGMGRSRLRGVGAGGVTERYNGKDGRGLMVDKVCGPRAGVLE